MLVAVDISCAKCTSSWHRKRRYRPTCQLLCWMAKCNVYKKLWPKFFFGFRI